MRMYVTLALILLVPALAIAQSAPGSTAGSADDAALAAPVPVDQQPSKEDLAKLFEVMHLRAQMQNMMSTMQQMIRQQMESQSKRLDSKYGQLTPEQQAGLQKILNTYLEKSMSIYTIDEMIDDMIPVYQRHFTKTDVDSLIAFYSTPSGQRMLAEQPVIMKEYYPVVMKHIEEGSAKLSQELDADIETFLKSLGQAAPESK